MVDRTGPIRPDVAAAMLVLSSIVLSDHSFETVLERAAEVTKQTVTGAAEVSVTMRNGRPVTVAASGELAERVDESQYAAGTGPCLDAIRLGEIVLVDDLASDERWPEYSPTALEAGVRSSLSLPLPVDEGHRGALNIYGLQPYAFDAEAVATGADLATYAAITLNNASLYFTAASRADQMVEAMASRAVIEQAKGILMGSRRCTADDAFAILVKLSQDTQRKLHVVARAIVAEVVTGRSAPPSPRVPDRD